MTQYCPICQSEYQDYVENCPNDGAKLSSQPQTESAERPIVDFYAASSDMEALRIVAMLESEGIASQMNKGQISQLPMVDEPVVVSVNREDLARATHIVQTARRDGIVTVTGMFL